ncbi:conserved unknown protein [Ectocarpus siliculosus]|uniref:Uncharacterized protein n=1 Tax=Ectocarpus siliculosus TaxID=2880 RepID=D8LD84_ECTSI|nr:conserved unknown protein [Ectocarpus siliculosus]|eukprot:CBN75537.1 conserved unknown protein [Ectocarpus siliculosus]
MKRQTHVATMPGLNSDFVFTRRGLETLSGELGALGEAAKAERHVAHSEVLGARRDAANAHEATTAQLAGVGRQVHGVRSDIADARKATTAQLSGVAQQVHGVKHDIANAHEATTAQLAGVGRQVHGVRSDIADARKATTAQLSGVAQQVHGVKHDIANAHEATTGQLAGVGRQVHGVRSDIADARKATTAQLAEVERQVHGVKHDVATAREATIAQLAGVEQQVHGVKYDVASSHDATMAQLKGARSQVADVKWDLASVSASVDECRSENELFFKSFTQGLAATHRGIETLMSAPLKEAEMALKNFTASGGNVRFLDVAHSKAMTALVQGHTVDVKLSAAVIAVSAGYVFASKTDSPLEAKQFTVNGTLVNIVDVLAPLWVDSSRAASADGPKVLAFLLNLVSCVCALPPVAEPVLPDLDKRLLPAFGTLCATEPGIYRMYPEIGGVAARALLASQTMRDLFELADEVDVDVARCTSKDEVIQILLGSGKALFRAPATGVEAKLESQTMLDLCQLAREKDVDIDRYKTHVIKILLGSGKDLNPTRDASTDRAALLALFIATNGPSWTTSTAWGTAAPLGEWYGVTVDDDGRVSQLELRENGLSGVIPPEFARLTALTKLNLGENNLTGEILHSVLSTILQVIDGRILWYISCVCGVFNAR